MNTLQLKKNAPSGTIVLNLPAKRNALSREMLADLIQAFNDFHGEKSVRAIILTGAGGSFCSGIDLRELQGTELPDERAQWQQWEEDVVGFRELLEKMLLYPKPIIAAVNGPAYGGGLALAAACDLIVASDDATFAVPEPRRGLIAGMSAPLLTFRVGGAHAAKLLFTSQPIDSAEALRIGLIAEKTTAELTWVRAHEIAKEIALGSAEAIQLTKKLLYETIAEPLGTQFSAGAAAGAASRTTEAAKEGIAAFLEKRAPKWP